ncbi:hypothetical protein OC25_17505 [Pedobacter kyungheensis]|uniref:Alkyl hydroperoxide reductase subunit C/ Thiol specific antioxidant domain-containing protein n=1 Tax=Pedobacter kyungheensis TaxID=1069985 RepID=A0A0C1DE65_9SPHI|nr:hypothetical protein [Pedobacter kyungheensis]KIA92235.1 hypothetical protein OC25_17505 [Pedobacter kyungheensis]
MNSKKNSKILGITLLIFIISACQYSSKKKINQDDIRDMLILNSAYSGRTVIQDSLLLTELNGNKTSIENLIKKGPTLFLRLTENNCNTCYEQEILRLEKLSELVGINKIALLVSFSKQKYVEIFARNYNIKFPIYNVKLSSFYYNKIEELNQPYLFVLDKSNVCENIFIPNSKYGSISQSFYDKIKRRLE